MTLNTNLHLKKGFHDLKHTQNYETQMSFRAKIFNLPFSFMSKMFNIEENVMNSFGSQFPYL